MAAAAILKIQLNGHNLVAIAHIRTKFSSVTKNDVPETEIPPHFTTAKIQDGGRPPFWKHINRHNSAARPGMYHMRNQRGPLPPFHEKFWGLNIFKMGMGIYFSLVPQTDSFNKFGVKVDTGRPRRALTWNFNSEKSKMVAAAILKVQFNGHNSTAITRSVLQEFT